MPVKYFRFSKKFQMLRSFAPLLALFALLVSAPFMQAQAPGQGQPQYPIADKLADKIIAKYQTSSCAQLAAQKQAPPNAQHEEMETKLIDLLKTESADAPTLSEPDRRADRQQDVRMRNDSLICRRHPFFRRSRNDDSNKEVL